MANKLKIYEVEYDNQIYEIEAEEGIAEEELFKAIPGYEPVESTAPRGGVTVADGVGSTPALPKPYSPNVEEQWVQGASEEQKTNKPDWMTPEENANVARLMNDPTQSFADIDSYVRNLSTSKGLFPVGLEGTEQGLQAYRESVAKGEQNPVGQVDYSEFRPLEKVFPEGLNETGSSFEGNDSFLAEMARGVENAWSSPDSILNALSRTYLDWSGAFEDKIDEAYPDITPEQKEQLQERVIGELAKKVYEGTQQGVAEDRLLPWALGQLFALEPYDIVPIGKAAKAATLGGRITEKGVDGVLLGAGTSVAGQGLAISDYAQDEFDPAALALNTGLGGALHGGIQGVAEGVSALASRAARPETSLLETDSPDRIPVPTGRKNSKAFKQRVAETTPKVQELISSITDKWENAPNFEVLDNFNGTDIPDKTAIGVYREDGTVVLNTEAIALEARARKVFVEDVVSAVTFHEGLGHYGLAQKFGDDLDRELARWYDEGDANFRETVDKWMAENPEAYAGDPSRLERSVEEVLAEWSEKGQLPAKFVDRITNKLKEFARAMGLDLAFSEREVRAILGMAHSAVVNGKGRDVAGNGFKFMYAGRKAQNADRLSLNRAMAADANGSPLPRGETGWFKAPDGVWRFEISDKDADLWLTDDITDFSNIDPKYNQMSLLEALGDKQWRKLTNIEELSLSDVLIHDKLFEAYPQLENVKITPNGGLWGFMVQGSYNPSTNSIFINPSLKDKEAVSTLLHEVQHAVQRIEGFARGGNTETALDLLPDSKIEDIRKMYVDWKNRELAAINTKIEAYKNAVNDPIVQEFKESYRKSRELFIQRSELEKAFVEQYGEDTFTKLRYGKPVDDTVAKSVFEDFEKVNKLWYQEYDRQQKAKKNFLEKYAGVSSYLDLDKISKNQYNQFERDFIFSDDLSNAKKKISKEIRDLKVLIEGLEKAQSLDDVRLILKKDKNVAFQAYEHLFGEVEARDVQARLGLTDEERLATQPYTSEGHLEPNDFIFVNQDGTAMSQDKYMRPSKVKKDDKLTPEDIRDMSPEDLFELQSAKEIISLLSKEAPERTVRTWDEAKSEVNLRGLSMSDVKAVTKKGIGELDKRLFLYDALSDKMNESLTNLYAKMQNGTFTINDKSKFLQTVFKYNELVARVFEDQAEVGRALNAVKAISLTRRNLESLNTFLNDYQGGQSPLAGFADDRVFNDFADKFMTMLNTGNPAGANLMVRQTLKPYWWQYILSFRHAMMLSGLATHAKNTVDNAMMIARNLEEKALALPGFAVRKGLQKTGMDVKEGVSPQEIVAHTYGIVRALLDSQTYAQAYKAFKEGHGSTPYSAKIEMQDARIPVVGKINDLLYAQDIFFRAFHTNANLYALGVRQAREAGFRGKRALEEGSARAANPDQSLIKEAESLTDEALLVDTPSMLSSYLEAAKSIRPNMKASEQVGKFTANLLFPFLRVTDRLLFQAIRRSPLSFLDKNTRADFAAGGARRDIAIARTLYGSALIAYYWNQDEGEGSVQGEGPSDYKKRQALEAGGWRPNSVLKEGKYVDATALNLSWLPWDTQNALATNIAEIRDAWRNSENEKDVAERLGAATMALLFEMSQTSYAENVQTLLAPIVERSDSNQSQVANAVAGQLSAFVPAAARQLNQQVLDPIKRDTVGDRSVSDRIAGRLKSGIPGLSEQLPEKYDLYGDTMPQGRTTFGMDNYTDIKTDPVSVEVQKLEKTTDSPIVTGAPTSFQHNNQTYTLDARGKQDWQYMQGQQFRQYMEHYISQPEWKTMTTEEKIAITKQAKKWAYEDAKAVMLEELGIEE